MAKKPDANGRKPLANYWMPPAALEGRDLGVGAPRACLATTFEFDAAFFEAELLPRFLGLKFDQTENEPSFVLEREEHLACIRAAVLVDASRFDARQSTLRWDQIPIRVPGGLLHAKVTVLWWERLVRVVIGSANLTRSGYRRNREVFAALDFWDGSDSVPLSVLRETLDFLDLMLEWSCASPAVRGRTTAMIDDVRLTVRGWDAPREFKPRQRPRVSLAITCPKSGGSSRHSALDDLLDTWGKRRASSVCVMTPFVGQDALAGGRDRVIEKLNQVPRARDCQAYLVVPELPANGSDDRPCVEIPKAFGESWSQAFAPSRAFVLPLPLCVVGTEERKRNLHAKALLLEGEDDALLMIGSSNFTPHGMGIGSANVEANLVFLDSNRKRDGILFADRLGLPLGWDDAQPVGDITWHEPEQLPADVPIQGTLPPAFFKWATFSQESGELRLELDRDKTEPSDWRVSLPGDSIAAAQILFSRLAQAEPIATTTLRYSVPERSRGVNIVALMIEWTDCEGPARFGVCAESPESLLPPSEFRELGADAIIECLISGKSPAQWYDLQQRKSRRKLQDLATVQSLRAVDTSGYLLYRVRRFGRALTAMRERIRGTSPRPDAVAYRLLQDPFGPVALAKRLAEANQPDVTRADAHLTAEQRVFLLAELLLVVGRLRMYFHKITRGNDRKRIAEPFQEAERRLMDLIGGERSGATANLPDNLADYIEAVQDHISSDEMRLATAGVKDAG